MGMLSGSFSVVLFQLVFGVMMSMSCCDVGVGSAVSVIFCFMSRMSGVWLSWMGLVSIPFLWSSVTYCSMFSVVRARWKPWGAVPWVISITVSFR